MFASRIMCVLRVPSSVSRLLTGLITARITASVAIKLYNWKTTVAPVARFVATSSDTSGAPYPAFKRRRRGGAGPAVECVECA